MGTDSHINGSCDLHMRPVVGFEGLYSVCPVGHVRSHRRKIWLRSAIASNGYANVILYAHGRKKGMTIHRLVYSAHVGKIPPKMDINHINGMKTDNRKENLEVLTRKANAAHAVRIGLCSNAGERHGRAVLTNGEVGGIVSRRAAGERVKDLADEYGVSPATIGAILHGRRWGSVTKHGVTR